MKTTLASILSFTTAHNVKTQWAAFCSRQKVSFRNKTRGNTLIEAAPDFWGNQPMQNLLDRVSS